MSENSGGNPQTSTHPVGGFKTSRDHEGLGTRITGWAVGGALAAGAIGLVTAVISLIGLQFHSVGMCVLGAGVAFGLLANAALRR